MGSLLFLYKVLLEIVHSDNRLFKEHQIHLAMFFSLCPYHFLKTAFPATTRQVKNWIGPGLRLKPRPSLLHLQKTLGDAEMER